MAQRELKYTIDAGQEALTVTSEGREPLVLRRDELNPSIVARATMHGIKQKVGDAANKGSITEKWEALSDMMVRLRAGEWTAEHRGGEHTGATIVSLCEIFGARAPETVTRIVAKVAAACGVEYAAPVSTDTAAVRTWFTAAPAKMREMLADDALVRRTTAERRVREAGTSDLFSDAPDAPTDAPTDAPDAPTANAPKRRK